jgi:hypothetical protein
MGSVLISTSEPIPISENYKKNFPPDGFESAPLEIVGKCYTHPAMILLHNGYRIKLYSDIQPVLSVRCRRLSGYPI